MVIEESADGFMVCADIFHHGVPTSPYHSALDKLVEAEYVQELTEHQQIYLRIIRQFPCLDFLVLHQFGNLIAQNIIIDYLCVA